MAELAFYVRAKYDEAIRLREELGKLRMAMMDVDESTEQGKKSMEDLAKKYHETSIALNGIIDTASEAALFMKQGVSDTDKAVLDLIHTVKQGESSIQGVFSATREQMGSVVENLNAAKDVYVRAIEETREKIKELRSLRNQAFSDGNLSDGGAYNTQIDAMEKEIREYERVIKAIDEKNKSTQDEVADIEGAINAYEKQAEAIKETKDLTEEQARNLEKALGDALDLVLGKTQNFQETVKKVASVYKEAKELAEKFSSATGGVAEAAVKATKAQTVLHAASLKLGTALVRMGMSATAAKAALALIPGALGVAAISAAIAIITNLIRKHREAKAAAEEAHQATLEYYEEVGKGAAPAIEKFEDLRVKYVELRTEMEKKKFIEDNKKALDELGVSVRNVKDADDLLINGVDEYVQAQIRYAEADLKRAQAQEKIAKAASLRMQIEAAEASGETKRVKMTVTNAEAYRMTYGQNADISSLYNPEGTTSVWKEVKVADMLKDELEGLTGEITDLYKDMEATRKSGDQALQSIASMGPQPLKYEDSLAGKTEKAKSEWEKAKAEVKKMRDDAEHYTAEQLAAKEADEAKWRKEYESLSGRGTKTSGGSGKSNSDKESEKRKTAIESYNKQIQAMIRSVENDIAKEQIAAIEDNSKAIEAQLDLEKQALVDKAEEIGKAMSELFAGNVDLLHRKTIDASKLVEKGWEDAGEGIATVFSSGYGAYDKGGKMHELLITPILPNGEVLSPEEVQDYIDNVLDGAGDFLAADEKGIVIAVDVDEDGGEKLHEMQEVYYDLLRLVDEYDAIKRENRQKGVDRRNGENQIAYLQQYGTFEEKRSAIRKKYQKERENEETEWGKKILDIREKTELAGVDAEQTAFRLANARRSGNIAEEKKQLASYYDIQIKDAEAKNERAKATELLEQKEKALFELQTRGDYAKLFGDIQKYTQAELNAAKALGETVLKSGELTKDQQKDVREALNAIEEEQRMRNVLPSGSIEEHLAKYIEGQRELRRLRKERNQLEVNDDDELFRIEEQIKRWEELTGKEKETIVWRAFSQSVETSAKYMRDLADATGYINVEGIADMAEGLSFTVKLLESMATGGWIGAIMAVVSEIVSAVSDEVKLSKELELRTKGLADAFEMLELSFDARKFSSLFGTGSILTSIKEYSRLTKDTQAAIADALDELGETFGKFDEDVFEAEGNYYNRLKAFYEAQEKGQKGLELMLVKTKNRSGIANFFGFGDEYQTLHDIAPQIFKEDGSLDFEKTEIFLKSDMSKYLDDTQRQALENAVELNNKYEENLRGLKDSLSSLFGNINDILADATMNGIKNGSRMGVEYMKDQMNGVVEALGTDLLRGIYSQYTSEYESKMLEMIKNGNASSGDFLNLLDEMMVGIEPTLTAASEAVREFNEKAKEKGYNIDRPSNADASTRSFQQISETTGSAIQGGVTALRLSSEVRNERLSLMSENLDEMLRQQMLSTTIAENIRAIQVDSYLALIEIRNNTAGNLAAVRGIAENVASIERRTREL